MTPSARPTISIALCTYNGEAYLATQWQSLLEQHVLPDEIVVCDDQSTDHTVALLKRLAADAPFPVRILVNETRLGFNKNFERVLSECTGELIFICDQDDCWFPEKVGVMTDFMVKHPETQVAFCDAWVTDAQLKGRQSRFWSWVRFDESARIRWQSGNSMDVMLDGNRVMGCATVIRRSVLASILPVPDDIPGYIYDGWIALVAAAQGTIQFVDQPLQLYRTHEKQQIGVGKDEDPVERIRLRDRFIRQRSLKLAPLREKQATLATISRLLAERVPGITPGMAQLHRQLAHFTMRSCLPHDRLRRFQPVIQGLRQGDYKRYADASANWYAPVLAALGDMLE